MNVPCGPVTIAGDAAVAACQPGIGKPIIEEQAVQMILVREPELQRTPTNNPGFDLTALGPSGEPAKWVEVKAMSGTLEDRAVG